MMKKVVSLLLALVMALGLVVPVWGNDLPSGTEPLFFYGQDNKQEWHYFNGTGLGQGNSVTFDRVYKDEGNDSYTQLTGFTVDSQATAAGLTATVNGGALTVTAANDCDAEVKFVVIEAAGVKYALRVIVNESSGGQGGQGGQGGPPTTGQIKDAKQLTGDKPAIDMALDYLGIGTSGAAGSVTYKYVDGGNSDISINGTSIGPDGLFTDTAAARAAVNAYYSLQPAAQNILDTLYLRVNDELWMFSRRMDYFRQLVQIAEAKGDDSVPTDPLDSENEAAVMLKNGGFTAPALGRDMTITFPEQLVRGVDYNYNYALVDSIGVLTVEIYKGEKQHWIEAARNNPKGINYQVIFRNPTGGDYHESTAGNGNSGVWDAWAKGEISLRKNSDRTDSKGFGLAAVNTRDGFMTVNAIENYGEMMVLSVWNSNENMNEGSPVKNLVLVRIRVVDQFSYEAETGMVPAVNVKDEERVKVTGVNAEIWNVTREAERLVVRPKDGTLASKFENGQISPIGTLTIKAPEGYTELDSVIMNRKPMNEKSFENGAWTCPRFFPFQDNGSAAMVSTRTFVLNWKSGSGQNAKYFPETFTLYFGESSSAVKAALNKAYIDNGGTGSIAVSLQPGIEAEKDIGAVGDTGISVAYDEITGGFHTTFDSEKGMPTLALLEKGMVIEPSTEIKGNGAVAGFHAHPFETNNDPQNMGSSWFDSVMKGFIEEHKDTNHTRTYDYSSNTVARTIPFVATNKLVRDGVTVYFSFTQAYRGMVIEWVDAQDKVLGYTFAYGRNDPFVATTQTDMTASGPEENRKYSEPFAVGPDGGKFWCERYPQEGGNGQKWYFRLRVSGHSEWNGEYTVYLPYSYLEITDAEAQRLINSGRKARIDHYVNGDGMAPETLEGTYTEWGICFKTRSFSPFVISTAAQSSSGGGYYYGGASTPGISAVKTADAAKSATDYTSGIYGLTFRSTAAFSGFKGVQVDGRTIAAANYVAEDNGGIEVYLKAVYLRTLKDGRHTVTILSDAGNVTMNFTIGEVDSPTTFDAGIGAYVSMALASVGGMAWMSRKKR